jgi:hypothetical protein
MQPGLAIIVPAGPGDRAWRGLLPQLAPARAGRIVLVLADGDAGLVDDPPANLQVLHSSAGRALQLNAGARATDARWLWFLHADSRVAASTLDALHRFVDSDESAIGYFRLRFLGDGPRWTFLNAWGAHFRSRVLGLPFGDQGLLMPRRIFDAIGGFDEGVAGGEDHDLVWAARARRIPLRALAAPVFTSARRYARQGWWQTTCRHLSLTHEQAGRFSRRHGSVEPK